MSEHGRLAYCGPADGPCFDESHSNGMGLLDALDTRMIRGISLSGRSGLLAEADRSAAGRD